MKYKFKKNQRLLTKKCFQRVLSGEKKKLGTYLKLNFSPSVSFPPKLGITASSHFGNAAQRNLFKRRIREIFRQNWEAIAKPVDIIVYPMVKAKKASYNDLKSDFLSLMLEI